MVRYTDAYYFLATLWCRWWKWAAHFWSTVRVWERHSTRLDNPSLSWCSWAGVWHTRAPQGMWSLKLTEQWNRVETNPRITLAFCCNRYFPYKYLPSVTTFAHIRDLVLIRIWHSKDDKLQWIHPLLNLARYNLQWFDSNVQVIYMDNQHHSLTAARIAPSIL